MEASTGVPRRTPYHDLTIAKGVMMMTDGKIGKDNNKRKCL